MQKKWNFMLDQGGTFTDIYCEIPSRFHSINNNSPYVVTKLLSKDENNYQDAPREGIRRILHQFLGKDSVTSDNKVDSSQIGYIRMGTTVATNALLEREGEPTALIITKGFKLSGHHPYIRVLYCFFFSNGCVRLDLWLGSCYTAKIPK